MNAEIGMLKAAAREPSGFTSQPAAPHGAFVHTWPWEQTPWWHWRQLLGQKWRRYNPTSNRVVGRHIFSYQTEGQRARQILEEQFNVGDEQQAPNQPRRGQGSALLFD